MGWIEVFAGISVILFGVRAYTRMEKWRSDPIWEDITLSISLFAAFLGTVFIGIAVAHGLGRMIYASESTWMVAIVAVRISLCLTLIRLKKSTNWTQTLYGFMIFMTVGTLALVLPSIFRCRSVRAAYTFSLEDTECLTNTQSIGLVYGLLFISDIFFALVPVTFVYRLRRPLRERVLIGGAMGIGLLAVITSTIKLYYLYQLWFRIQPQAYNYQSVKFLIPTWVEVYITIIGATVPALNAMMMSFMREMGIMTEKSNVWGLGGQSDMGDVDVSGPGTSPTSARKPEEQQSLLNPPGRAHSWSFGCKPTVIGVSRQ